MVNIQKIIEYLRWPTVFGVIVALGSIVLFPDLNPNKTIVAQPRIPLQPQVNQPVSYADAVRRAQPSVVNIYTSKVIKRRRHPLFDDPLFRQFFNSADIPNQRRMQSALGSGVIIRADGYLITNNHVIHGADEIVVQLFDGREEKVELIGVDEENDLAILKLSLNNLIPIPMPKPEGPSVGDVVLAIGNPFGMGQTVTQGIISATGRHGLGISKFENFIQTDATINPGNSGGALIDAQGNLVGINTAILNRQGKTDLYGVGLAVPAQTAIQALNDIIETGKVIRGWLGVNATPLTPQQANYYGLPTKNGLLITGIHPDSPAFKAELRPGDVIVKINKQTVSGGRTIQKVQEARPGAEIEIEIYRNGQSQLIRAILGSRF